MSIHLDISYHEAPKFRDIKSGVFANSAYADKNVPVAGRFVYFLIPISALQP